MKGAWVETILNISLSIILVIKFGLIGVAIGTLVAMLVRTSEFIYHTNKYVLKRSILISIKKVILIVIETILIVLCSNLLPEFSITSYLSWFIYAVIVFMFASFITITLNYLFYKKDFHDLIKVLKKNIKRKIK